MHAHDKYSFHLDLEIAFPTIISTMSVLPPEVHNALTQLLHGLQSTDNTVRSQAEEQLNTEWINQRPDMLLMGLAEQMQGSQDEGVSSGKDKYTADLADGCIDSIICCSTVQAYRNPNIEEPKHEREPRDLSFI